ncbi:hypothetical protein SAMN04487917_101356 [Arthrobacter sp. yr096]|nr:hypothetical protein SAMN04487917_101356 [Arthrobacter sp. yr096]
MPYKQAVQQSEWLHGPLATSPAPRQWELGGIFSLSLEERRAEVGGGYAPPG